MVPKNNFLQQYDNATHTHTLKTFTHPSEYYWDANCQSSIKVDLKHQMGDHVKKNKLEDDWIHSFKRSLLRKEEPYNSMSIFMTNNDEH